MRITLEGAKTGHPDMRFKPFEKPNPDAAIYWPLRTKPQFYYPYLVKVVKFTEAAPHNELWFQGVNLDSPNEVFGPEDGRDYYSVDLRDHKLVHIESPSTLDPSVLQPNGVRCYAILFLSTAYVAADRANSATSYDPNKRLLSAQGGPKWPQSAGKKLALEDELAALQRKCEERMAAQSDKINELRQRLADDTNIDRSQIVAWLDEFAAL